jgi:hypothetical protein
MELYCIFGYFQSMPCLASSNTPTNFLTDMLLKERPLLLIKAACDDIVTLALAKKCHAIPTRK